MSFADRLKAARAASGHSQYTLADASGIARTMLANYEQGRHEPDIVTLVTIAKALGVSTDALLGLEDAKPPKSTRTKGKAARTPGSTVEEAQALAKAQGRTYCEHHGKAYRLRRDGWEPV